MIRIYAHGACQGNPGNGGWAALIIPETGEPQVLSGSEKKSTNERLAQTAVVKALEEIPPKVKVRIYSESLYVIYTTQGRLTRRANPDLWAYLDERASIRKVEWELVKPDARRSESNFVFALAEWQAKIQPTRPRLEAPVLSRSMAYPVFLPDWMSLGAVVRALRSSMAIWVGVGLLLVLTFVSVRATTVFQDVLGKVRGVVTGGTEEDLGQILEATESSPNTDAEIKRLLDSLGSSTEGRADNREFDALLKGPSENRAQGGQQDADTLRALLEEIR